MHEKSTKKNKFSLEIWLDLLCFIGSVWIYTTYGAEQTRQEQNTWQNMRFALIDINHICNFD